VKRVLATLGSALVLVACGAHDTHETHDVTRRRDGVVYDDDARVEVHAASDSARGAAAVTAALVPRSLLDDDGRVVPGTATVGDLAGACEPVRFAEQPAAAFCSAVLVDADLVLTAAHCLRALPLGEFAVVFDYFYTSESELGVTRESHYTPVEILAERMDAEASTPRFEYAWLRLERAAAGREPVALRTTPPRANEPLVVVSTTEGAPLKVDPAVRVVDARPAFDDFFVADSDTFHGSSGGGAFDENGALLGVLARGAPDYAASSDGDCTEPNRLSQRDAAEEYSLAGPALRALCAAPLARCPAICDGSCAEPHEPVNAEVTRAPSAGCSLSRRVGLDATFTLSLVLFFVIGRVRRVGARSVLPTEVKIFADASGWQLFEPQRAAFGGNIEIAGEATLDPRR